MPEYLIGSNDAMFSEGEFAIVTAATEADAVEKYIREKAIKDEIFQEYLADRSSNMGFASHFWLQSKKEHEVMTYEGRVIISEQEFRERVCEFFKEWPGYADLYLKFYDDEREPPPVPEWPEEMLVMIWKASDSWDSLSVFSFEEMLIID